MEQASMGFIPAFPAVINWLLLSGEVKNQIQKKTLD